MKVTKKSTLTGRENSQNVEITLQELIRIEHRMVTGELIQDIVPFLSRTEREFLMTGITQEEWVTAFGENN
jgi:hypothetical protein